MLGDVVNRTVFNLPMPTAMHVPYKRLMSMRWLLHRPFMSQLTDEEKARNETKLQQMYFHHSHALTATVHEMVREQKDIPRGQRHEHKQAIHPDSTKVSRDYASCKMETM